MSDKKWGHVAGPERLADWRAKQKNKNGTALTQQEAADRMGFDLASYNAFENGRERPGLEYAVSIERVTDGKVKPSHWVEDSHGTRSKAS